MTSEQLHQWRETLGFSQAEAARRLKVSTRCYERWEAGERQPPRFLGLACAAIAEGVPSWEARYNREGT